MKMEISKFWFGELELRGKGWVNLLDWCEEGYFGFPHFYSNDYLTFKLGIGVLTFCTFGVTIATKG